MGSQTFYYDALQKIFQDFATIEIPFVLLRTALRRIFQI
jgi:hypothetical protein